MNSLIVNNTKTARGQSGNSGLQELQPHHSNLPALHQGNSTLLSVIIINYLKIKQLLKFDGRYIIKSLMRPAGECNQNIF